MQRRGHAASKRAQAGMLAGGAVADQLRRRQPALAPLTTLAPKTAAAPLVRNASITSGTPRHGP